jgi:hypothetical protein
LQSHQFPPDLFSGLLGFKDHPCASSLQPESGRFPSVPDQTFGVGAVFGAAIRTSVGEQWCDGTEITKRAFHFVSKGRELVS